MGRISGFSGVGEVGAPHRVLQRQARCPRARLWEPATFGIGARRQELGHPVAAMVTTAGRRVQGHPVAAWPTRDLPHRSLISLSEV